MEDEERPIEQPSVQIVMSQSERDLCDRFVKNYLMDYDSKAAAVRVGYPKSIAQQFADRFMGQSYVLQQIAKQDLTPDAKDPEDVMKQRIMQGLLREANYKGPGSSQSARVAALARLASIYGMDAPKVSKTELTGADGQPLNSGGFFVVPGLMSSEAWEEQAAKQQAALVDSSHNAPIVH